ncbi:MAG: four helix bundle protein [Bacteroidales bacterium]|nr:four helix bundle protein [Bacteroidales bacterium]
MRQQIENRLIHLSVGINQLTKTLDNSLLSQNIAVQIIRSSSSAALNYGEAQGAESKRDFIHKSSIVLKELRETHISLKLIKESKISLEELELTRLMDECNQLIAIFHKTVTTAKSRI